MGRPLSTFGTSNSDTDAGRGAGAGALAAALGLDVGGGATEGGLGNEVSLVYYDENGFEHPAILKGVSSGASKVVMKK